MLCHYLLVHNPPASGTEDDVNCTKLNKTKFEPIICIIPLKYVAPHERGSIVPASRASKCQIDRALQPRQTVLWQHSPPASIFQSSSSAHSRQIPHLDRTGFHESPQFPCHWSTFKHQSRCKPCYLHSTTKCKRQSIRLFTVPGRLPYDILSHCGLHQRLSPTQTELLARPAFSTETNWTKY